MSGTNDNDDFVVWCDDSNMAAVGKIKELPKLPPHKQRELEELLADLIRNSLSKSEQMARIAV